MQYLSRNLYVEIFDGEKLLATIKTFDAKNPIISYQLDQSRSKISKIAKEYEVFSLNNQDKINANDPDIIEKLFALSGRVRDANIEHLKECIVDFNSHLDTLKLIPGAEFGELQSAIMRSQFGIVDGDEKKNLISPRITKPNSGRGTTRKKK